ncbi:unnamed protein product [Heterosigma akashiwo]|mmetsp:Transcript_14545/g.20110  ORF Transcript_14545/g.20110 Transcript_14545/m.20110 type:complete len:253 (+) Transcript_14545:88-846(+)
MADVVPQAQVIDRQGLEILDTYGGGLFVKQTKRGCIQELLGCEAKTEFKISTLEQKENDVLYTLEESTFIWRFCFPACRPFEQPITVGNQAGGPVLMSMKKPVACGLGPCECCFIPTIDFLNSGGESLGGASVPFYFCIPNIKVAGPDGTPDYHVHMPTCCGGVCVNCMAEGLCNCKIPFYIYKPDNDMPQQEVGKIIKLWRGLGTEMFTDASTFQLEFPEGADAAAKARLLGTSIFINFLFFERQNDNSGG